MDSGDTGADAPSLGFIGLGMMGRPMAERLVKAGHRVTVFDIDKAAVAALVAEGALAAESVADVGAKAEVVFASLPTPDIVRKVTDGLLGASRVRTFIDLSTTGPVAAAEISETLGKHQIVAMEAPVSGGVAGARKGTLAVMVSGPEALYDRLRPILAHLGKTFFVGETPGAGQTMKLVNNLLSATAMAISAEAMVMGVKAGLDPQTMVDVISAGSGRNSAIEDKFPRSVMPGTFDFGFTTGLCYKDVKLALDTASALDVPMVVGSAVRQMLAVANARFGPDSDFTIMARTIEEWAHVDVRSKEAIAAKRVATTVPGE